MAMQIFHVTFDNIREVSQASGIKQTHLRDLVQQGEDNNHDAYLACGKGKYQYKMIDRDMHKGLGIPEQQVLEMVHNPDNWDRKGMDS